MISYEVIEVITADMIIGWHPCEDWPEERIRKICPAKGASPLKIARARQLSVADRLWLLLREDVLGHRLCHEIAADYAERVLPIFERERPDDTRMRDCIEVRRRYARGEAAAGEMAAARAAASSAAGAAAWDAAGAARAAAWDAARVAAGDAARYAAGVAERAWQLRHLIKQLKSVL